MVAKHTALQAQALAFLLRLALLGAVASVAGCGRGDSPLDAIDPEAAPAKPTYEQVRVVLDRSCVPCHGRNNVNALEEDDDDESPDYSTCEGTRSGLDGLRDTVLDSGSMPPGAWPRLSSEEKLLVQRWIEQGACSPCTDPCP